MSDGGSVGGQLTRNDAARSRRRITALIAAAGIIIGGGLTLMRHLDQQANRDAFVNAELLTLTALLEQCHAGRSDALLGADEGHAHESDMSVAENHELVGESLKRLIDGSGAVELGPLASEFASYAETVSEVMRLTDVGNLAAARQLDRTDAAPSYDRLAGMLATARTGASNDAERSATREGRALWLVMLTSAGLLLGLVSLHYRSVVRSRIARAEQQALRRLASEREYESHHDELTGLPNRRLFCARIDTAIAETVNSPATFAILLLDLDRFKELNDTLGHSVGDEVLASVAHRLRKRLLGKIDVIARLGGDEFAVMLPLGTTKHDALAVAATVRAALDEGIEQDGMMLHVDASIGVAEFPEHGTDRSTLLRRADVAMYASKTAHSGVELYELSRDSYSKDDLELTGALRHAISAGELVVHFQPQHRMVDGRIRAVEALVRWQHPTRGLMLPGQFLRLAEQTSLMRPLTLYVLDEAIRRCAEWIEEGADISVAVNLGAASLFDTALADEVKLSLERWSLPAERLELEITEKVFLGDTGSGDIAISKLIALGVRLSVDDFGTGYSSIGRLREFAISQLKIDRSLISDMDVAADNAAIVRSAIELGHALGLEVVAEGVETESVWIALQVLDCDLAQGFLRSRPMAARDITAMLATERASATFG